MEMYRVYRTKHRYYLKTWESGVDEPPRFMSCAKRHGLKRRALIAKFART